MDNLPAEAQLVHRAWMQVFNENVATLDEFCKDFLAIWCGCVQGQGFFIRIELQKVVAWAIGVKLEFVTGGVAAAGTLNFYNFCPKPCKQLGAGWT